MSTLTPWRTLLQQSLEQNGHLPYAMYQQLATVRTDGRPAVRTIAFRGFLGDSDNLTFVTDERSRKVSELRALPCGEICWYFHDTKEQFRLSGKINVVDKDCSDAKHAKARQEAWKDMSSQARNAFTWPEPGVARTSDDQEFRKEPPEEAPVDNFCLLLMEVEEVDYHIVYDLNRMVFESSQDDDGQRSWSSKNVNP